MSLMSSPSYFISLALVTIIIAPGSVVSLQNVTCGSVFKLMNVAHSVRLHSHDIKYGTGSGQQSVTGNDVQEDSNSNWVMKGLVSKPCHRGEPIFCDSKIRLEHLDSAKNLHSHLFTSPLSSNQEISAYGIQGEGDTGDVWQVKCPEGATTWKRDDKIQLKHVDTSVYLSASGETYGRPISGQMEVVGEDNSSGTGTYWQVMEGIFIHPTVKEVEAAAAAVGSVDNSKVEL